MKLAVTMTSSEERQKQNYSPYNYAFALLIFMPRFDSINFYQNRPRIRLFFHKTQNFRAQGAPPPEPRNSPPYCRILPTHLAVEPIV